MSEPPTSVKEERASPGPDSPASVVREDITIKVEPKMEWENPPQSFSSFANLSVDKEPAATVKKEIELEALGGPSGSSQPQNMEVIDNAMQIPRKKHSRKKCCGKRRRSRTLTEKLRKERKNFAALIKKVATAEASEANASGDGSADAVKHFFAAINNAARSIANVLNFIEAGIQPN